MKLETSLRVKRRENEAPIFPESVQSNSVIVPVFEPIANNKPFLAKQTDLIGEGGLS